MVFQKLIDFYYRLIQQHSSDLSSNVFVSRQSDLRVNCITNELSFFFCYSYCAQMLHVDYGKLNLLEWRSLLLHLRELLTALKWGSYHSTRGVDRLLEIVLLRLVHHWRELLVCLLVLSIIVRVAASSSLVATSATSASSSTTSLIPASLLLLRVS